MIKVIYNDEKIKISGHALYASHGHDIVCASVSSIIYTTINGILSFDKDALQVIDDKDLTITILKQNNNVRTLINNMLDLLKDLEKQYPKNIKISKGE